MKIINKANDETEILIYEDIGDGWFGGVSAKAVAAAVKAAKGDIVVRLNSPGGDAFVGLAIYNTLIQSGKKITTQVDGMAFSAASIIFMAGSERRIAENAFIMIHEAFTMAMGNAAALRERADALEAISDSLAKIYVDATGQPREKVDEWMAPQAGTWFGVNPENDSVLDAVKHGFATEVIENLKVAAKFDPARYGLGRLPVGVLPLVASVDESRRANLSRMNVRALQLRASAE